VGAPEPTPASDGPDEWTRLATRLFARAYERPRIAGRYEIVGQLGRGGMGVVYAALDHELGRKVAVKLLHLPSGKDGVDLRARVRHEALALARLADPNVVAIYDVCEHEGRLALVMEHVEGDNLRVALDATPARAWSDVLRILLAAAKGLQAAHEAGLVHGDVKPDNILVGRDGRVRVVDFGLAIDWHEPSSNEDAVTQRWRRGPGTPRYMAPEQLRGEAIGPWTDQFALCVTMREGLDRVHPFAGDSVEDCLGAIALGRFAPRPTSSPVPLAVHRALERGLSMDPEDRWPSIGALVARIERAVAPRPMPWALTLGVVGLVAIGARFAGRDADARCIGDDPPPWVRHDRAALRTAVLESGAPFADDAWKRIDAELGEFAQSWERARSLACASTTPAEREIVLRCLERTGRDADARARVVSESSARTLPGAIEAVVTLADPAGCLHDDRGGTTPPSGVALEEVSARVRALVAAGRYGDALPLALDALRMAQDGGRSLAIVETQVDLGGVLEAIADYDGARARFENAALLAEAEGLDGLAADAATHLSFLFANRLRDPTQARVWLRHAEAACARAGDPLELRARIAASEGHVLEAEGDFTKAREVDARALAWMTEVYGAKHPLVATATHNLGLVAFGLGDFEEARTLYERTLAARADTLGADHPLVGTTHGNLGAALDRLGDSEGAERELRLAVEIAENGLGTDHPQVAAAYANLAITLGRRGDMAAAEGFDRRALAILEARVGPDHPNVALVLANHASRLASLGRDDEAERELQRALAIQAQHGQLDSVFAGATYGNLATLHLRSGDARAAAEAYERATAIFRDALGTDHPDTIAAAEGLAEAKRSVNAGS
jgi:tetratricopeptide (TPR) repeat protein